MEVSIVADDVTGGAECLAGLGRSAAMLTLASGPLHIAGGSSCVVTDSRILRPDLAAMAVRRATAALASGAGSSTMLVKKVDSLCRGPLGAEVAGFAEVARAHGRRHVMVAPALPDLHRTTRAGRQWLASPGGEPALMLCDLIERLDQAGVAARAVTANDLTGIRHGWPGARSSVWVVDAASDADLDTVARWAYAHPATAAMCGSGALVRALGRALPPDGAGAAATPPRPARVLLVCGSQHPRAAEQVSRFTTGLSASTVRYTVERGRVRSRSYAAGTGAHVAFTMHCPDSRDEEHAVTLSAAILSELIQAARHADAVMAVGGQTAAAVMRALRIQALTAASEVTNGVFAARATGDWQGTFYTKPGSFGAVTALLDALKPTPTDAVHTAAATSTRHPVGDPSGGACCPVDHP